MLYTVIVIAQRIVEENRSITCVHFFATICRNVLYPADGIFGTHFTGAHTLTQFITIHIFCPFIYIRSAHRTMCNEFLLVFIAPGTAGHKFIDTVSINCGCDHEFKIAVINHKIIHTLHVQRRLPSVGEPKAIPGKLIDHWPMDKDKL